MLYPTDFASEADYVAAVVAEEDGTAHGDDPAKSTEHSALLELVPRTEATHIAVSTGSWTDPSTWYEGRIPEAGARVLIPEAITVNYDSLSNEAVFTVRVDGELAFVTEADTLLKVDTLVISTTGKLEIGTETAPVQPGVTAQIVIADNGPIDVTWDPLLLSRGLISHGEVTIHGQEKDSYLKVAFDAMKGDTQLILEGPPDGWQIGDRVVLTGTHFVPRLDGEYQGTQDEELTIAGINGNIVTLDRPLSFDHDAPRADLNAYVANYSRNVSVSTEHAEDLPVHQRGHTMFMHSDDVDVRYAEFNELGRTNKAERAVDATLVEDVQVDTNVQGRYSVHLHRAGANGDDDPAILIGNSVWGSPGWGFTHHQSNALLEHNASYNTFGAGFVAETGNEIGAWRHNIAIKAEGVDQHFKNAEDEAAFDLARTGDGFWFQGRLIEAEGNIAAGVNHGFIFMHRGVSPDLESEVAAANLDQPEILRHDETAGQVHRPPIQHFLDNEAFASARGFLVVKNGGQNQEHDVRSVIENFTAWEVASGVVTQYTSHYTFLNLDLLGTTSTDTSFGINFSINSFDMVVNGATVEGFKYGIAMKKGSTSSTNVSDDQFGYVLIDVDATQSIVSPYLYFDPAVDMVITSSDLSRGQLRLNLAWHDIPLWDWNGGRLVLIEGVKTDSIGAVPYPRGVDLHEIGVSQMSGLLAQEGYYTTADGRKIVIVEEYFADRANGELMKIGIPIQLSADVPLTQGWFLPKGDAIYGGEIDLASTPPVVVDESVMMLRGTAVAINALLNDSDPDSGEIWIDGLTQPRHGNVEALGHDTLVYVPDRNFTGRDSFNYWVTDGNGSYTRATVQLNVVEQGPIVGGAGVDSLYGGQGNDVLMGGPGADLLDGRAGHDTASYQDAAARVVADLGHPSNNQGDALGDSYISIEALEGSSFEDQLFGAAGHDTLLGGAGDDLLGGGAGDDVLSGGVGGDLLGGGEGADRLYGQSDDDTLFGGPGDDSLGGAGGDDFLAGQGGQDVLRGGSGNDRLVGGADEDVLAGGGERDILRGGPGDDVLSGGIGGDLLGGGEGADRLYGRADDDALYGGPGDDNLIGGSGDDRLIGGAGDDVLSGGIGGDLLAGGEGADRLYGRADDDALYGGPGDDSLGGGAGEDFLAGQGGQNVLRGGSGNDRLIGGDDEDVLAGGGERDILRGGPGDDVLIGGPNRDRLLGGGDNDVLRGGGGDDVLHGGPGLDRLFGGGGDDVLIGGAGSNNLFGNSGADRFVFQATGGNDTVLDFHDDLDRLDFRAFNFANKADAIALASQAGANVVFNLPGAATAELNSFDINLLGAEDIII